MRHAKFFSIFVFVVVLSYGAIGLYFLPLANFQGDLTRMAQLPETLFGWTKPQPTISPDFFHQASWHQADVLVIGDSFSEQRVWQSVLTQRGLKVRTEMWGAVQNICEDFMPWLHKQGFSGKYVVFERIERSLVSDIQKSLACKHMLTHGSYSDAPLNSPIGSFDLNQASYTGRLSIGIKTQLNMMKYERGFNGHHLSSWSLPNGVRMSRLKDGCSLFSHMRCKDVLFSGEDRAEDIHDDTLKGMTELNTRLIDVTPVWVVVPNKSTSYLYFDKKFWDKAEQQFDAPNILREVRQAIQKKTIDLYPGNNTHFSTTGYLLMGDAVYQHLQQAQPHALSPPQSH